jgi:hypothetical protein
MFFRAFSRFSVLVLVCCVLCSPADVDAQGRKPTKKKAAPKKKKTNLPAPPENVEIKIAPVSARLKESAIRSAARIDMIVARHLKKNGMSANSESTDEQFVRRVFLDIAGTIPTSRQAEIFFRSRSTIKRIAIIDYLLNRPGYASHFYNYWADVLRLVDKPNNNNYIRPYNDWIKKSLRDNTPFNSMVHEMLTAEGKVWDNPAVGFVLRDQGMRLDNLNNAMRIFLGTRIGCAQCHDHPFDKWTQHDFYQLAAFTSGVEDRMYGARGVKVNNGAVDKAAPGQNRNSPEARLARSILRLNRAGVWHNTRRTLKYPSDYQYKNAEAKQVAIPAVMWNKKGIGPVLNPERRSTFADWVVDSKNERFPLTLANRLWKRVMGLGLIEPVDDMTDDTEASNPELLNYLVGEMKRLKYNMKEFQRILYFTKTYQRRVVYSDLKPDEKYLYPGPLLKRMTAEQVWDSLLTLTVANPDAYVRPSDAKYISIIKMTQTTTAAQVIQKAKQLQQHRKDASAARRKRLYKGIEIARASELPQPLPEGHFLRQFGQSDRGIISDSHTDGTVPQLLTMFNGPVTHMMLEGGSVIYNDVVKQRTVDDQIDAIFLALLSRKPNFREKSAAQKEMKASGNAGYGNVIWALLNTREFLFIQ